MHGFETAYRFVRGYSLFPILPALLCRPSAYHWNENPDTQLRPDERPYQRAAKTIAGGGAAAAAQKGVIIAQSPKIRSYNPIYRFKVYKS